MLLVLLLLFMLYFVCFCFFFIIMHRWWVFEGKGFCGNVVWFLSKKKIELTLLLSRLSIDFPHFMAFLGIYSIHHHSSCVPFKKKQRNRHYCCHHHHHHQQHRTQPFLCMFALCERAEWRISNPHPPPPLLIVRFKWGQDKYQHIKQRCSTFSSTEGEIKILRANKLFISSCRRLSATIHCHLSPLLLLRVFEIHSVHVRSIKLLWTLPYFNVYERPF